MGHHADELGNLHAADIYPWLHYLNRRLDEQEDNLRHAERQGNHEMIAHYVGSVDILRCVIVELEYELQRREVLADG